jgi:hypothetical protein
MRKAFWTGCGLVAAALLVSGCRFDSTGFDARNAQTRGRYAGIGIYSPDVQWTRIVAAQQARETPAAKAIDDQAIIVVVDSVTGEVRSCGDLTGYCIGMNPWTKPLASTQVPPIQLTEHVKPDDRTPVPADPRPAKPDAR